MDSLKKKVLGSSVIMDLDPFVSHNTTCRASFREIPTKSSNIELKLHEVIAHDQNMFVRAFDNDKNGGCAPRRRDHLLCFEKRTWFPNQLLNVLFVSPFAWITTL